MDFFKTFTSATTAGMSTQSLTVVPVPTRFRAYYRIDVPDAILFSLLYNNTVDSTFADGSVSRANRMLGSWQLMSLRAGLVKSVSDTDPRDPAAWQTLTFGGKTHKRVNPGELFATDPFPLSAEKGDFICIEMVCQGAEIPAHPEVNVPFFVWEKGAFRRTNMAPVPSMVGCNRGCMPIRIGFWGDSITQGLGTPNNSYDHYASVVAEKLGYENKAYWDIALGFARGKDAATIGSWMYKARQNDIVSVCFGVNDLLWGGPSAEDILQSLRTIVDELHKSGVKVLLQTIPPFDYNEQVAAAWHTINAEILRGLDGKADAVFDNNPILSKSPEEPHLSKYGAHPDSQGHKLWGEALAPVIASLLPQ